MAMSRIDTIFLGHTPSDQRKYLTRLLGELVGKYPKIYIPAVGQFTMVKCAIEAGYKKENIITSDISLYSSVLGYLASGRSISEIDFSFSEKYQDEYDSLDNDIDRAAFLFYVMKILQMEKADYLKEHVAEMLEDKASYIHGLKKDIDAFVEQYQGITYEVSDLRDYIVDMGDDSVVVLNPPVFAKGYTKMFDFGDDIRYDPCVEEFSWKNEYHELYNRSLGFTTPFIWYRFGDIHGINPAQAVYCKEYKVGKTDFWLCTKPEIVPKSLLYYIKSFRRKQFKPLKRPVFTDSDIITRDTKVEVIQAKEENALYYRDLWAHKLGNTKGEQYYLILLDGKVFGTFAVTVGPVYRLSSNYYFENYGFSAYSRQYPRSGRLLMWIITCSEFRDMLVGRTRINRFYKLLGMETTCLSKYRNSKSNNGIVKTRDRERMANGMYKIHYVADFRDETFQDCLIRFIDEEEQWARKTSQSQKK